MLTGCLPSRMKGAPAGLTRRPQMSDEMRSELCQSGPLSITTTFLPALASTAAKTEPDAPAPTMTTSTFSCVAMSPPLFRRDVWHVGNAQRFVAFHGAVDHVDRIAAHDQIDEAAGRALPSIDLVLPHGVDEIALLGGGERREATAAARFGGLVDGANGGTIEVDAGRLDVELARLEQRLAGRNRHLLIDEMRNTGALRAWHQRLAHRLDGLGLVRLQQAERHALCPRLPRRHQHLGAAHRKGEHAHSRALEKDASFHGVHGVLRGCTATLPLHASGE